MNTPALTHVTHSIPTHVIPSISNTLEPKTPAKQVHNTPLTITPNPLPNTPILHHDLNFEAPVLGTEPPPPGVATFTPQSPHVSMNTNSLQIASAIDKPEGVTDEVTTSENLIDTYLKHDTDDSICSDMPFPDAKKLRTS
jgi:hypothetical protein